MIRPHVSIPFKDINILRNSSIDLDFAVKQPNSEGECLPFNILHWYVRFTVEDILSKSSNIPADNVIITDATHGLGTFKLLPADTLLLVDGAQYRMELFNSVDILPFVYGTIKILTSVI